MSWVTDHKARWATHRAAAKPTTASRSGGNASRDAGCDPSRDYAMWAAACKQDWDALKAIPDHAVRNRRKPAMLDKYRDYLSRWAYDYRQNPHQNDVLTRNLVWACDAEQWEYALQLADDCVATNQVMTFIERPPATFVTDSLVQWMEKNTAPLSIATLAANIAERVEQQQWDINHVSAAKLYRALAKHEKTTHPEFALVHATKAHDLYPNVGVKTLIEDLHRQLKTSPPPQVGGADATGGDSSSPDFVASVPAAPVLLTDAKP